MAGLEPSVTHDTAMTTHLTDHLTQQHENLDKAQIAATIPDNLSELQDQQQIQQQQQQQPTPNTGLDNGQTT